MSKILVVIDMQNDFITGTLGSKEAQAIVPNVKAKIKEYADRGDRIIFTRDTHGENYLETPEGKKLPVKHCVKGTDGWQIVPGLEIENCEYIDKPTFGWLNWDGFAEDDKIELIGVCTDICAYTDQFNLIILCKSIPVQPAKCRLIYVFTIFYFQSGNNLPAVRPFNAMLYWQFLSFGRFQIIFPMSISGKNNPVTSICIFFDFRLNIWHNRLGFFAA